MPFSEQFKNSSFSNVAKDLIKKYELEKKTSKEINEKLVSGAIGQNELLNIIEQEREQEKDEKKLREYDILIAFIKNFFAKKNEFNFKKALQTLKQKAKDEALCKKALELSNKYPILEQFAKQLLGEKVVEELKATNAFSKKAMGSWVRKL